MPYLVDGHNLIPHVGLRLDAPDDELGLIRILQEHSRRVRHHIEVYFDGAPFGQAGTRKYGRISAHFVSDRSTADAAILARLQSLKKGARNWTVVSSDAAIRAAARAAQAMSISSSEFARMLLRAQDDQATVPVGEHREGGTSDDEVRHWLNVFKQR